MNKDYLKITIYEDGSYDVLELTEQAYEKLFDRYNANVETIHGLGNGQCWMDLAHAKVVLCKKESLNRVKNKFNLKDSKISDIIKETSQGYIIYSHKGKRLSKAFKTKKEAEERLKEIEMFKHMKKDALMKPELAGKKVKILVGNALSHEIDRAFGQDIISKNIIDKNKIEYILPYNSMFEYIQRKWNRRYEVIDSDSSDYQLVNNRGHVDIYKNGKFVGSADNESEAKADIEQMKKEESSRQKVAENKKWKLWYTNSIDESAYTIVEAPTVEEARIKAKKMLGRELRSNFRDIELLDSGKEIKDMFEEVKKWLEKYLVKKDDPNNKLGKTHIRSLRPDELLPRIINYKSATDTSGILSFKGHDYYWYIDGNDNLHVDKYIRDSLDMRFFAKSYFDNKEKGVEDTFETNDLDKAKDWILDKSNKGFYTRLLDRRTGEVWVFEIIDDPLELEKINPYEESEDLLEEVDFDKPEEYTLWIVSWYDKKGYKHTLESDSKEDAEDWVNNHQNDEDYNNFKITEQTRSYNDSIKDRQKFNKEKIESKLRVILEKYLLSQGYDKEDIDEWVNIRFRNYTSYEGDKGIEIEIANDFVDYYDLPQQVMQDLDNVVAPSYFEPYSGTIWQAYVWDVSLEDSVKTEDQQQYIYQFPSDMSEEDLTELDKYNLKMIGKAEIEMFGEVLEDYLVQGSKEDLERYCKEYLDYKMHPDYLWKLEESPYK